MVLLSIFYVLGEIIENMDFLFLTEISNKIMNLGDKINSCRLTIIIWGFGGLDTKKVVTIHNLNSILVVNQFLIGKSCSKIYDFWENISK